MPADAHRSDAIAESTHLPPPARPAPAVVAAALARVQASRAFQPSRRHRQLLQHLVQRWLDGDLPALKETVIAVEVFGRPAARFDPKADTIVRVETRRLRQRLAGYYQGEGRHDPLRIDLPVGSYVPQVHPAEATGLPVAPPARAATRQARDLVERGEAFLRQPLSAQTLDQALARFDAALRESPDHVPALVGLGRAWFNIAQASYQAPLLAADHAAEALRRALALQPGQAEASALLGALLHSVPRDWPAARRAFEHAVAQAPTLAFAHATYGRHLMLRGRLDEAERRLQHARQLDPQYVNLRAHLVNLRIAQGRLADAQAELDALADLAPGNLGVLGLGGLLALQRGDGDRALACFEQACAAAPGHAACEAALAGALGQLGQPVQAEARLAALLARPHDPPISPYVLATAAARCGRPDDALALLQRCLDDGDPNSIWLQLDPSFAALHGHPRWPALVQAMRRPHRAGRPALAPPARHPAS